MKVFSHWNMFVRLKLAYIVLCLLLVVLECGKIGCQLSGSSWRTRGEPVNFHVARNVPVTYSIAMQEFLCVWLAVLVQLSGVIHLWEPWHGPGVFRNGASEDLLLHVAVGWDAVQVAFLALCACLTCLAWAFPVRRSLLFHVCACVCLALFVWQAACGPRVVTLRDHAGV